MNKDIDIVLESVCWYVGVDKEKMITAVKKQKDLIKARQIGMYILKTHYGLSYYDLAKIFNRDHTTCYTNCKKITKIVKSRPRGPIATLVKAIISTSSKPKILALI